jgi:MerR family transcriptional regulator, light-induced transcriptional regulator
MKKSQSGYYSTKELAKLFRVDESTIKRWTNAGKLNCFKTPGGHRKYTSDHVLEFIRAYSYEVNAEKKDIAAPDPHQWAPVPEFNPDMMRELFLNLSLRGSVELLLEVLQRSHLSHYPLVDIYENIVGKNVMQLAEMRRKKIVSKEELHKASSAITNSIVQFRLLTPRILPNGKTAVTASLTYGAQDIILLCAAHLLEMNGWKVYYLGSNVSVSELATALRKFSPDVLCLPAEYVLADQNGGIDATFSPLAAKGPAECLIFDYFNEVPQGAGSLPYRKFTALAQFSEYVSQRVPTVQQVALTGLKQK